MLTSAVTPALSALDDESCVHSVMREIRQRYAAGRSTSEDHRRYRACWRALALRRSPARRTVLPPEIDEQLACRQVLLEAIKNERARMAVDAVFSTAPGDETPTTGTESLPR